MATAMSEIPKRSLRVLVVDDSPIACYILYGQLAELDFAVDVANLTENALATLERALADIKFMGHLVRGIDGLQALSSLLGLDLRPMAMKGLDVGCCVMAINRLRRPAVVQAGGTSNRKEIITMTDHQRFFMATDIKV